MATTRFRMDPDQMEALSRELDSLYQSDFRAITRDLTQIDHALEGAWTGSARQAFQTQFGGWLRATDEDDDEAGTGSSSGGRGPRGGGGGDDILEDTIRPLAGNGNRIPETVAEARARVGSERFDHVAELSQAVTASGLNPFILWWP